MDNPACLNFPAYLISSWSYFSCQIFTTDMEQPVKVHFRVPQKMWRSSPGIHFFTLVLITTKHTTWIGLFDFSRHDPSQLALPPFLLPLLHASASLCQLVKDSTRHPVAVLHRNHCATRCDVACYRCEK